MNSATCYETTGETAHIARTFSAARLDGRSVSAFPGTLPTSLAIAYGNQEAGLAAWPDPVGGWKVARIGPTWRSTFPEERLIGPVFSPNIRVVVNGEVPECPVFAGGFAAVEAEIVIVVGKDAPPAKLDWTVEEAADLIGSVHVGIEIASSPLLTLNDLGPGAIISDFGNNWGIVLGPVISPWRDLKEIAVETFIDDVSVGTGNVDMVNGPLGALAFTLRNTALRGRPLTAGDVITTGMITGVHDIRIGQRSRHVFRGYGEVGCQIARAKEYVAGAASS